MGNKQSKMKISPTVVSSVLDDTNDINFDEASKEWKRNKKSLGGGTYKYVCGSDTKNGSPCQNKPITEDGFCYLHNK